MVEVLHPGVLHPGGGCEDEISSLLCTGLVVASCGLWSRKKEFQEHEKSGRVSWTIETTLPRLFSWLVSYFLLSYYEDFTS